MEPRTSHIKGLVCRECGRAYPADPVHVCEFCFGPLEVDYDKDVLRDVVSRERIGAGPASLWRYRDLLPIDTGFDVQVGRSNGLTPLVRAQNLAEALGVRELYVKNDTVCPPTLSFKDRVVAVAVNTAIAFGYETIGCASTGNLANSVAAHAAAAGLGSVIFIPADLEPGKVVGTGVYRPHLVAVEGTYDQVNRLASEVADERGWAFVNVNLRPYYAEGSKTFAYEIAEQLGWRAPGHLVVPAAGGSLINKIWKGLSQFRELGLIDGLSTRIHAAQAAGCGPIVSSILADDSQLRPVRQPATIAKSLAIGDPADGRYAYGAVKASHGHGAHATDDEIRDGIELLASTEGIFAETAGGVTVAATKKLIDQGIIPRDASIVVAVTGNGLKTQEALSGALQPSIRIEPSRRAFDDAFDATTARPASAAQPARVQASSP
ncbi:MAG: threonine synthase [Candidatus Bipolaricaulia bacterium]